ncbi:unnamed protein product [Ophioblennius macclurei]
MARCFCRWRNVLICVCTPCIFLGLLFFYIIVTMTFSLHGLHSESKVVIETPSPHFVASGIFHDGIFSSQPEHFWDPQGPNATWNQLQLTMDRRFNPILNLRKTETQQSTSSSNARFFKNVMEDVKSDFAELPQQIQRFVNYMGRRDYPVLLQPSGECGAQAKDESERPLLLFAIKTMEGNFRNRHAIRQSWGREGFVKGWWGNASGGGEGGGYVRRVFLLGKADHNESSVDYSHMLKIESELYEDMLQWDFHDTFFNLSLKDVLFWKYFSESCGQTAFVFKGDDDVFVNTPKMVAYLLDQLRVPRAFKAMRDFMVGDVIVGASPNRDNSSKYFIPENFYRGYYPRYAGGGGVVYSGLLTKRLHQVSERVHLYPIDDVFVGMCMIRLNAFPVYHPAFLTFDFKKEEKEEEKEKEEKEEERRRRRRRRRRRSYALTTRSCWSTDGLQSRS